VIDGFGVVVVVVGGSVVVVVGGSVVVVVVVGGSVVVVVVVGGSVVVVVDGVESGWSCRRLERTCATSPLGMLAHGSEAEPLRGRPPSSPLYSAISALAP